MTRFQYVILIIALFLLTAIFLCPPRRYCDSDGKTPSRGFLFGNFYVELQEFRAAEGGVGFSKAEATLIDYPRMTLEVLALGSATAFLVLLCRPRHYAD